MLITVAALGVVIAACQHNQASGVAIRDLSVEELVALRKEKGDAVVLVDANREAFRKENGTLPGARLLSSSKQYDVAKELPSDLGTPLVFYCTSSL
jgi:hypothetical protein